MADKTSSENKGTNLHFTEFMQICADSGYISESTAREICLFAKYQGGVEAIPTFPGDHPDNNDQFTDLLAFAPEDGRSFDNYVVTDENSYAVELARTVALIPKIWKSISPILFHAGTGQGKTHLLSAMALASRQNTLFLNLNDLKMAYKYCERTNKESSLLSWITSHNFLLLDDLQFVKGDMKLQHFLCSVFNIMPQGKSAIVLCCNSEVENMKSLDKTFFSRITSGISVELKPMDISGRISVLEKMFRDTGFGPGPEIVNYIATRITQNVRTLKAAGRAVFAHLLTTSSREEISIEITESLLNSMNLCDPAGKKVKESATTDSPEKEEETFSPYIVVDIDDEEKEVETDEEIFQKAVEIERTKEVVKPETAPAGTTGNIPDIPEVKEEIPADTGSAPVEHDSSTREHTIKAIENATNINSQIEALKLAAERRIQQLMEKKPDSPEIAKLRFAIVFLDQGKIESAMLALK